MPTNLPATIAQGDDLPNDLLPAQPFIRVLTPEGNAIDLRNFTKLVMYLLAGTRPIAVYQTPLPGQTLNPDGLPYRPLTVGQAITLHLGNVKAASTGANVNTAAPGATLDGVTLLAGDRILLKDQTTQNQNGLYTWSGPAAALVRTADVLDSLDNVFVQQGTVNAGRYYTITTTGVITIGTTNILFAQTDGLVAGTSNQLYFNIYRADTSGVYPNPLYLEVAGRTLVGVRRLVREQVGTLIASDTRLEPSTTF
jgi:hypothetical protein